MVKLETHELHQPQRHLNYEGWKTPHYSTEREHDREAFDAKQGFRWALQLAP